MTKLKYKGRAVKIVKVVPRKCFDCIFYLYCTTDRGAIANDFEIKNKLKDCYNASVKYIYE